MPRSDPGVAQSDELIHFKEDGTRIVYERAGKPSQLVKAPGDLRFQKLAKRRNFFTRLKLRLPGARYRYLKREYAAYYRAMRRGEVLGRPPPLPHLRGLILTEKGIGQIVQKVRGRDGEIAPTLRRLASEGRLDQTAVDHLNRFIDDVVRFRIVAHDLTDKNIVYETRQDRQRFVMIDGFGDETLIPVRRWFPALNERKVARDCAKMARKLKIVWREKERQFSLPED